MKLRVIIILLCVAFTTNTHAWNYSGFSTNNIFVNHTKVEDRFPRKNIISKLKVANRNAVWTNSSGASNANILSPWYKIWWVQTISIILIITLIIGIIKLRTQFLRKQKRKLEEEVQKRTRQIENQKAEIEEKNRILESKNQQVEQRNHQIISQFKALKERNEEIKAQQEKIQEKSRLLENAHQNLKKAHEELKTSNNSLEFKVDQRTRELQEAMQKLIKTDEELNTFLYRSSHDLRGPIVSLLSLTQLITQENKQPVLSPYLEKISNSCMRMLRFLKKLNETNLLFKSELEYFPINFNNLLNDLRAELSPLDPDNHVTKVYTNLVENDIYLDYSLVQVIIQNLLENAIIFQKLGNPYCHLTLKVEGDQLIIEVRDNGLGIENNIQDKVFKMFYRGSEYSIGNGLGLYMVQRAVNLMNGTINLFSRQGEGTRVNISIPMKYHSFYNKPQYDLKPEYTEEDW